MGQKIHPIGFRLSVLRNWTSRWYANSKNFPGHAERGHQGTRLPQEEAVARRGQHSVVIERPAKNAQHHDPQRASRRGHRQEGRGHRVVAADSCSG